MENAINEKLKVEELSQVSGGTHQITKGYAVVCGKCNKNISTHPSIAEADEYVWCPCPTCGRIQAMGYQNYILRLIEWVED